VSGKKKFLSAPAGRSSRRALEVPAGRAVLHSDEAELVAEGLILVAVDFVQFELVETLPIGLPIPTFSFCRKNSLIPYTKTTHCRYIGVE